MSTSGGMFWFSDIFCASSSPWSVGVPGGWGSRSKDDVGDATFRSSTRVYTLLQKRSPGLALVHSFSNPNAKTPKLLLELFRTTLALGVADISNLRFQCGMVAKLHSVIHHVIHHILGASGFKVRLPEPISLEE
ncbi:hypothetical protein BBP40_005015 [Aspergillus hancockii]|nr:hypothetical protein BBP40_005015 [Aspergillus hancockii]